MARDFVALMRHLGAERFSVAGHDRGGRVAYRLALDHPERVAALAVLDIVPTGEAWARADWRFVLTNPHWGFLVQSKAERVIGADPDAYYYTGDTSVFHPEALADYRRSVRNPETIHAMCEDYRAGATFDRELDWADQAAGRRIRCPVHVLWAARDELGEWYDPLEVWREWADDVSGCGLDSGHFLAEERPDQVTKELRDFFAGGG
jgi:haloacetate dehalogenase